MTPGKILNYYRNCFYYNYKMVFIYIHTYIQIYILIILLLFSWGTKGETAEAEKRSKDLGSVSTGTDTAIVTAPVDPKDINELYQEAVDKLRGSYVKEEEKDPAKSEREEQKRREDEAEKRREEQVDYYKGIRTGV